MTLITESEKEKNTASKLEGKLLLRVTEVAYLLGLSRSEIYKLISSSDLPSIRIGRSVRVPRGALELWIVNRERRVDSIRPRM